LFLGLYSVVGAVLMGLGRADMQFRLSLACGCSMLLGVVIGSHFGIEMATVGVTVGAAVAAPFYLTTLARQLGVSWLEVARNLSWPLVASSAMALAVLLTRRMTSEAPPVVALGASVLMGAVTFLLIMGAANGRQILADVREIVPTRRRDQAEPA
jgi:hypothetical protein